MIGEAHHAAVTEVVAFIERDAAAARTGAAAGDGAVAQVDVTGMIATAFDHFDSRAGDPHLRMHVVISNKAKTTLDGNGGPWVTGRCLLRWWLCRSLHEALFVNHMTRMFGVSWDARDRGRYRNPAWAIPDVPETLVDEFFTRAHHIDAETDRLIEECVAVHGRWLSPVTIMKLRAKATLSTRPTRKSTSWQTSPRNGGAEQAASSGSDPTAWAMSVTDNPTPMLLQADDIPLDVIGEVGESVMVAVGEKLSTWRRWNLAAEDTRQTMGWRFVTIEDREAIVGLVADAAEQRSLRLTPPELVSFPVVFRRGDESSVFRPKHSTVFSSHQLLQAEDRLLTRSRDLADPTVPVGTVEAVNSMPDGGGRMFCEDQAEALTRIAVSGRVGCFGGADWCRENHGDKCVASSLGSRTR
ncbi:relaxase domain-containing protein [Bifidobacterium psychraerophilum]|uniref:Conjugative relaxase domain-containing protein n=1 Tax=Bifidobacterium psychraerophilum TaxID=218140 RepID=A0A087CCP1_9BIFI|nr:relaxase domain-containing protein [Bifidobacterium psychraerophilum]KFI81041.1 conjugative relaxase domain-containing protein [Bifidobacterium psychraerophilum]